MTHSITKASIGDIAHKTADNKQGYAKMKDLPYDNRKLNVVIETLFGEIEKLKEQHAKEIESIKEQLETENKVLRERLDKIESAFETNIKEWLSI